MQKVTTWANLAQVLIGMSALLIGGAFAVGTRINKLEWDGAERDRRMNDMTSRMDAMTKREDAHDSALSTLNVQLGSMNTKLDLLLQSKGIRFP